MRANTTVFQRVKALVVLTVGAVALGSLGVAKAEQQRFQTSRFDELDRNGDGRISLNEWLDEGSRREFETLDLNGDGFLTPREFSRRESNRGFSNRGFSNRGFSDRGVNAGESIFVNSAERWTDTGISVESGDTLTFDAEGRIQMSDNPDDVATPAGARSGRLAPNAPLRLDPAGMLIARIGNSEPMAVGQHRTMRAPRSGELYLGVNDDHLPDNRGEYHVIVNVEPR
jgi:hypothetical protein